jgi:hypothetical protein
VTCTGYPEVPGFGNRSRRCLASPRTGGRHHSGVELSTPPTLSHAPPRSPQPLTPTPRSCQAPIVALRPSWVGRAVFSGAGGAACHRRCATPCQQRTCLARLRAPPAHASLERRSVPLASWPVAAFLGNEAARGALRRGWPLRCSHAPSRPLPTPRCPSALASGHRHGALPCQ